VRIGRAPAGSGRTLVSWVRKPSRHPKTWRYAMRTLSLALLALVTAATACAPASDAEDAQGQAIAADAPPDPWEWSDEEVRAAVEQIRGGRDLTPDVWPNGARVAVSLSFDVDNETLSLRTGEITPGPLSQGEYGSRTGLQRVLAFLDEESLPATFFFPAWSLKIAPDQAKLIQASGRHEIGVHGWIHETNSVLDSATERQLMEKAVTAMTEMTGTRPVGYRAPSWNMSAATLDLVREMGFLYESSLMADDRPYELVQRGQPTGIVELPVEWILDDAPLVNPQGTRYSPPREVMQVWIDEFDKAHEEGTLFLLTMHPHIIGHRSRMVALEGLVRHIKQKGSVWFATHEQVARYVREKAGMN
jgi:peptidoglycan/xylan/chitin deacetylase (PgdA/CDA1 family)